MSKQLHSWYINSEIYHYKDINRRIAFVNTILETFEGLDEEFYMQIVAEVANTYLIGEENEIKLEYPLEEYLVNVVNISFIGTKEVSDEEAEEIMNEMERGPEFTAEDDFGLDSNWLMD